MSNIWIFLVIVYSVLKGARDPMKKAALKKNSSGEILFFYTLIGFIMTIPFSEGIFEVKPIFILAAFLKALIVCTAWLLTLVVLKKIPVGLYGIIELSRLIFSMAGGILFFNESMTGAKYLGSALVILGLLMVNLKKDHSGKRTSFKVILLSLTSAMLNATSGVGDKFLTKYITSAQLQFWFMLFTVILYGIYIIATKEKLSLSTLKTNYWIPLMSLSLIIGDRALFEANANPASEVTIMTILKQSAVVITVLSGRIFFKEKGLLYKLLCTAIVVAGILIATLL